MRERNRVFNVPRESFEVAERRVSHLLGSQALAASKANLTTLLVWAYSQGLEDAVELHRMGRLRDVFGTSKEGTGTG